MSITPKEILAFVKRYPVGVVCGLVGVIMLAGLYLRSDRADDLSDQSKQLEEQSKKILGEIRNGANIAEQYAALSAKTKDLDSRLIRGSERALNQRYFYRIESDTGVKEVNLQQTSSGAEPGKGDKRLYCGIGYSVIVTGDFRQILDFVGKIESGQYFYRLISATVSRKAGDAAGAAPVITLSLNIELLGLP